MVEEKNKALPVRIKRCYHFFLEDTHLTMYVMYLAHSRELPAYGTVSHSRRTGEVVSINCLHPFTTSTLFTQFQVMAASAMFQDTQSTLNMLYFVILKGK